MNYFETTVRVRARVMVIDDHGDVDVENDNLC